jgi:hypothetical protein
MFSNLGKTVRSKLLCRPREGGDPVSFAAKSLDSRLRGNDTELLRFIANQMPRRPPRLRSRAGSPVASHGQRPLAAAGAAEMEAGS